MIQQDNPLRTHAADSNDIFKTEYACSDRKKAGETDAA